MKVLVLNGSPKGTNSITLQTVNYLEKQFEGDSFEVLHVGQRIRKYEKDFSEAKSAVEWADLILFVYPVYTFLVPSQLHRFIELMKEAKARGKLDLSGKAAAQISTSKHFYDVTAHEFIRENCEDMGLFYIDGLSEDMEDLLKESGRRDAVNFFHFLKWEMKTKREFKPRKARRVVIVADMGESHDLKRLIGQFREACPYETDVVNLREYPFAGGCLGCFHCAADGTCVYKDGFDGFLRGNLQNSDAIIYAFAIKDHSMGALFKQYDDRQFCNGHRTVTMGHPIGYLIEGNYSEEPNLRMLIEARAEVGGNYLAGAATVEDGRTAGVERLVGRLYFALEHSYEKPKNFYGVGGLKIFRDLIYEMQGLMREDHRFYKEHGFYDDFPQKHRGKIMAMYAVGAMMRNPKISRKLGGKMTEGMLMPYKNILKKQK